MGEGIVCGWRTGAQALGGFSRIRLHGLRSRRYYRGKLVKGVDNEERTDVLD